MWIKPFSCAVPQKEGFVKNQLRQNHYNRSVCTAVKAAAKNTFKVTRHLFAHSTSKDLSPANTTRKCLMLHVELHQILWHIYGKSWIFNKYRKQHHKQCLNMTSPFSHTWFSLSTETCFCREMFSSSSSLLSWSCCTSRVLYSFISSLIRVFSTSKHSHS